VDEHRQGATPGFTSRYRVTRLVYFEEFADIRAAIAREKAIKGWRRSRKISLVEKRNPTWEDLFRACGAQEADPSRLRRARSGSFATRAFRALRSG
jgi:putative endonuclease